MTRLLLSMCVLVIAALPALANAGPPPRPNPASLNPAWAAVAGAAGAILAGIWLIRRSKP